ncbi:hypothetical protein GCM10010467_26800 [Actinocorallia glomerata]|uniref:Activator of Hsp90 ATPase homologue 1/2-like C-terminal domain-containing protein n=3 Tax=Actinomycetota TaxID=201174 RepID=A0ABP6LQ86_9MICC
MHLVRPEIGDPVLHLRRRLPHRPDVVWAALSDPEQMSLWQPCRIELEPRPGGTIRFLFEGEPAEESRLSRWEPPHRMAYDWSGEHLEWGVAEDLSGGHGGAERPAASLLRLSNSIVDEQWVGHIAAGWDLCLHALEDLLAGRPIDASARPDEETVARLRAQLG